MVSNPEILIFILSVRSEHLFHISTLLTLASLFPSKSGLQKPNLP